MTIDHIISPVRATSASDLYTAQPITFETMRRAQQHAQKDVSVSLLAACFSDEEDLVPKGFTGVPALERSVLDVHSFACKRKLPLLRDVLQRLYEHSTADYLIYTNVDIAVMPNFYTEVQRIAEEGHEAFVINRRTIDSSYSSSDEISEMYADKGKPHPGFDCFVFRRNLYPQFVVGNVCLGSSHVDTPLICSMISSAKSFRLFTDEHLTFHIGDSRTWWSWKNREYVQYNDREASRALRLLAAQKEYNSMKLHIRLCLMLGLLKNSMIVHEWLRLAEDKRAAHQ